MTTPAVDLTHERRAWMKANLHLALPDVCDGEGEMHHEELLALLDAADRADEYKKSVGFIHEWFQAQEDAIIAEGWGADICRFVVEIHERKDKQIARLKASVEALNSLNDDLIKSNQVYFERMREVEATRDRLQNVCADREEGAVPFAQLSPVTDLFRTDGLDIVSISDYLFKACEQIRIRTSEGFVIIPGTFSLSDGPDRFIVTQMARRRQRGT